MIVVTKTMKYYHWEGCLRINSIYVSPEELRKERNEEVLKELKLGKRKEKNAKCK